VGPAKIVARVGLLPLVAILLLLVRQLRKIHQVREPTHLNPTEVGVQTGVPLREETEGVVVLVGEHLDSLMGLLLVAQETLQAHPPVKEITGEMALAIM
jgi:hypothetical protein